MTKINFDEIDKEVKVLKTLAEDAIKKRETEVEAEAEEKFLDYISHFSNYITGKQEEMPVYVAEKVYSIMLKPYVQVAKKAVRQFIDEIETKASQDGETKKDEA